MCGAAKWNFAVRRCRTKREDFAGKREEDEHRKIFERERSGIGRAKLGFPTMPCQYEEHLIVVMNDEC
jgi:hypothetical protein